VNGVDIDEWDPATDENIATHYWPGNMDGKKECKVRACESRWTHHRLGHRRRAGC